jgi:multicomponent Na+:H+ antiporter subunit E
MIGQFLLRLGIWLLLTANFSPVNVAIGVSVALLLPQNSPKPQRLKDFFQAFVKILLAIPQAYREAFEMILRPHNHEVIVCERVRSRRSPELIFLEIFLITFTPKTIVVSYHHDGWYEVHHVRQKKP